MGSTGKQRKCRDCGQPFLAPQVEPEYDADAADRHDLAGTEPKAQYAVVCSACAVKHTGTFEEMVGLPPKRMTQLNPYHKRRTYPYYKVQVYKLIPKYNKWAWVDIQKAHATDDDAAAAAMKAKHTTWRIIEVNERFRVPIFTHNENTGKTG